MKKTFYFILCLSLILSFNVILAKAHQAMLSVEYDPCIPCEYDPIEELSEGYDEKWYILKSNHIAHNENDVTTIKYYINYNESDEEYWNNLEYWQQDEIINGITTSMQKWNNVYFYTTDENGCVIKKKIVNIIQGTRQDNNLEIYLKNGLSSKINGVDTDVDALIRASTSGNYVEDAHFHTTKWIMEYNIDIYESIQSAEIREKKLSRTGAHEIGHILGLDDIDPEENVSIYNYHHEELLMGYGAPLRPSQENITYKDIAGVAITRGYHTDLDHKWMYDENSSTESSHKLICSICNGVKRVISLTGYDYVIYRSCNDEHSLSSGNMMAVASYENNDYYKCKYCKYVAPFEDIVEQNYSYIPVSYYQHQLSNQIPGLQYNLPPENHTLTNNHCDDCGYTHVTHEYTLWKYLNETHHARMCVCGVRENTVSPHTIKASDINKKFAFCLQCQHRLDLSKLGSIIGVMSPLVNRVTLNGSYILPSGIVVLVDEDIGAYLNGTLIFYNKDEMPESM